MAPWGQYNYPFLPSFSVQLNFTWVCKFRVEFDKKRNLSLTPIPLRENSIFLFLFLPFSNPLRFRFAVFCLLRAQLWPTIYNNRLKMHLWIAIIAQISRQYQLYIYMDLLRWAKFPWEHNQSQVTSSTQLKNKISCLAKANIPIFCTHFYFMYLIDIGQNFVDIVVNVVAGIGIRPSQHPQHLLRFS